MAAATMKYRIGFLALLPVLWIACTAPERQQTVFAGRPSEAVEKAEPAKTTEPVSELPRTTNIHFDSDYCLECHSAIPQRNSGRLNLRYGGDFQILCRCHYPESGPIHSHPTDTRPSESENVTVPEAFPRIDGTLTCRSCHDIYVQCKDSQEDRILLDGQMLLRGLPYDSRLDFCFRCHDRNRYPKFNPHRQIGEQGQVIESRCLYCHAEAPDTKQTTWEDVKLIGGFTELCVGCHYQTAKQPLHARHLKHPSAPILERMNAMQAEFNIVLPLDSSGRVTCATCHNPHQKGLIPDQRAGARGAGAEHRHRLQDNMCIKCHPMQPIKAFGPPPQ